MNDKDHQKFSNNFDQIFKNNIEWSTFALNDKLIKDKRSSSIEKTILKNATFKPYNKAQSTMSLNQNIESYMNNIVKKVESVSISSKSSLISEDSLIYESAFKFNYKKNKSETIETNLKFRNSKVKQVCDGFDEIDMKYYYQKTTLKKRICSILKDIQSKNEILKNNFKNIDNHIIFDFKHESNFVIKNESTESIYNSYEKSLLLEWIFQVVNEENGPRDIIFICAKIIEVYFQYFGNVINLKWENLQKLGLCTYYYSYKFYKEYLKVSNFDKNSIFISNQLNSTNKIEEESLKSLNEKCMNHKYNLLLDDNEIKSETISMSNSKYFN